VLLLKIQLKALLVAFIFAIAINVINFIQVYSPFYLEPEAFRLVTLFLSILRTIISPFLFFIAFYYIGKKIISAKEFWSHILSLFIGNIIGLTFSPNIILTLLQIGAPNSTITIIDLVSILGYFLFSLFSYNFFVGFSALASNYIIRKTQEKVSLKRILGMKIQLKVIIVAFFLAIVLGALSNISLIFSSLQPDYEAIYHVMLTANILGTIISPLLFFVTFFFIGKKIISAKEFWSHILSLFIGNIIGINFGYSLMYITFHLVTYGSVQFSENYLVGALGRFVNSLYSLSFFVGIAAVATSFIIKKDNWESGKNDTTRNDLTQSGKVVES
jgi:hypothetical protein